MVLHLGKDFNPRVKVFGLEFHLGACLENFNMGPLEAL
jgi:hypothetical protein